MDIEALKPFIAHFLEKFHFVKWDRYIDGGRYMHFYGWIDREKDAYKDFLLLTLWRDDMAWEFTTSSAAYDDEIKLIFNMSEGAGNKCQRVEHLLDIPNAIRI